VFCLPFIPFFYSTKVVNGITIFAPGGIGAIGGGSLHLFVLILLFFTVGLYPCCAGVLANELLQPREQTAIQLTHVLEEDYM